MSSPKEVSMNESVPPVSESAPPTTFRATVVQASTIFYDTPATLAKAEKLIAEAAGLGSQLIVFPEAFLGGYPLGVTFADRIPSAETSTDRTPRGGENFQKYHASAINIPGPEVERLSALAEQHRVYLVMGVIERDGYTLYCTLIFFDSQGKYLGKHQKLMPTTLERLVWGFGDGSTLPVYDTPFGKLGGVICWENRMPLLRTAMYAKGIQIYCAPNADDSPTWQSSMIHIAQEGGCFVLSANQFCRRRDYPPAPGYIVGYPNDDHTPDSVVSVGGSVIVSPLGTVLAGPIYEEGLITADLDLGEIARAKFMFDAVGHYSRPDVLSVTVKDHQARPVTFCSTTTSDN